MKQVPMTVSGAAKLREELNFLKNIRRPEIIKNIAEARCFGDLKENSEYHAAREEQSFCEARIKDIEDKLANAQIIDISQISPSNKVIFGVTVSIQNLKTRDSNTYRLVGDDEADFKKNMISINSPIARGLIGKKTGDTVTISTPGGNVIYEILKVQYL